MQNTNKFLINYSGELDRIHALSMPFHAEKYDNEAKSLYLTTAQFETLHKVLPETNTNVEADFTISKEEQFIILTPKTKLTKIVTLKTNVFVAIVINGNNLFLSPIEEMQSPVYTKNGEVFYSTAIEAIPTSAINVDGKTYTAFTIKLNGAELYKESVPYLNMIMEGFEVERLEDPEYANFVRFLANGQEITSTIERKDKVSSSKTKVSLVWLGKGLQNSNNHHFF